MSFQFFRQCGLLFAYRVVLLPSNGYLQAACWSPDLLALILLFGFGFWDLR